MPGETLRVVLGAAAGTEIDLDDTFTLGRTESGDGGLGGDPELSRQHARIARSADGTLEITDLGSTNGTHVNGVRIADSQRLSPGDTIRVGQTTLNVHGEPAGPVPGDHVEDPTGGLPGRPSPDPTPPSPTPEPGPPAPPGPDPAPPSPAPGPGPPGPPGPGPQIEEPGPFAPPSDEPVPEAEPPAPHGDPLLAPHGMTSGDPLAGTPPPPSAPPPSAPPPDPHGPHGDPFAAQVAAPPTGPPVPFAPPGPPAPAGQPGTQAYPPAPAGAYPPPPAGAHAHGGPPAAAPPAGPPVPTAGADASAYALKRPIGRQILLSILSFGIWGFYWYYDTRRKLNAELGKQDDAAVKTACMLIPIYNLVLIYQLWEDLNELRTRNFGLPEYNSAVLLIVAVIVPFGVFYSYPKIATELNQYWDVRTQGHATEAPVTTIEKVLAGVGAAILALYVLLIVIVIIAAAAGS